MYKVWRSEGRVTINDWKDQVVYSADPTALILYEGAGGPTTDEVGKLTDSQLLVALAKAIKLPL